MEKETTVTNAENHPHVQLVKNYQAAMARQDFNAGRAYFDPDVIYIVPGNNKLSGVFKGPDKVMGYFGKLMELTSGTYKITKQKWLVNDTKVALVTDNYAEINSKTHTWNEVIVFEIINEKKHAIEMFQDDQAALDEFYGH
jgi:ketosteroid isomerase-like protein